MQYFRRNSDKESKQFKLFNFIKSKFHLVILLLAILFLIGIIKVASPMNYNSINNENNTVFGGQWQYSIDDGGFRDVNLPFSEKRVIQSHITLKNRIPDKIVKGATVLIRSSQQNLEVFIDHVSIYSSMENSHGKQSPSSAYHFVRLPADAPGKEITVILDSPYERYSGLLNQIFIGSKASNIFYLLEKEGIKFIIGILVMGIGFWLTLVFLFVKLRKNSVGIVYLGLFFVCAGYWVAAESTLAQFLFPYPIALTNSSIFAMTLLPVFSGLYYYNMHTKIFQKIEKYIIIVMAMGSAGLAATAIIYPAIPLLVFPYYLVFIGAYVVFTFIIIIVASFRSDKFFSISSGGVIIFSICGMIELFNYLNNIKNYHKPYYLIIGLFIFCLMMLLDLAKNVTDAYQASVKVKALTALAYTDSLTGLFNRTAFLEKMTNISLQGENYISLGMFDINNLKPVNDSSGHLVGDALIKHSVQVLRQSIRAQDELFRIGGDEFAAVIYHDQLFDLESVGEQLCLGLHKENEKSLSYELSIAYGFATYIQGEDKDIFATLARADENMYRCKKKQKLSQKQT